MYHLRSLMNYWGVSPTETLEKIIKIIHQDPLYFEGFDGFNMVLTAVKRRVIEGKKLIENNWVKIDSFKSV